MLRTCSYVALCERRGGSIDTASGHAAYTGNFVTKCLHVLNDATILPSLGKENPDLNSIIADQLSRARERVLEQVEEERAAHVRPWDRGKGEIHCV